MKYRLKNKIIAIIALAVSFCVPGLAPAQVSGGTAMLSGPVRQSFRPQQNTLAVKSMPADFFGYIQKPAEVQNTENIAVLLQGGGFVVQASLVGGAYQIPREFFGSVAASRPIFQQLQVEPLRLAVHKVIIPVTKDYFKKTLANSSAPIPEKGILASSGPAFGLKKTLGNGEKLHGWLAARKLSSADFLCPDPSLVFRC